MKNNRVKKMLFVFAFIFVCLIMKSTIIFAGTLSDDINGIDENRYPGIKGAIQSLQNSHGNYHFQVYYTDIDWNEAVTMEYQGHGKSPKNLFEPRSSYTGKWYCPICASRKYDSGRWCCASIDAIKYMLDPRNSLEYPSIFQFKSLETSDVSATDIQNVINSKYATYSYLNNPTMVNAIVNASQTYNLNGYSILAKIINEQGKGSSCLAQGTGYNGYGVGYYNFFNVNASGNDVATIYTRALKYAIDHGWNSVENSVLGGSNFYKSQYIGKGQNTLYYQRFNVAYEQSLFSHQYQQDIMGAETSARLLAKYYEQAGTVNTVQHTFIIPLFENMPAQKCSRPSTTENSELKYVDATVLVNGLAVKSGPNSNRVISYLNAGEKVKVLEYANKVASDGNYWDIIISEKFGVYGYVIRSGISAVNNLPKYVFDYKYYADNNPDVKKLYGYDEINLLFHYLNYGIKEGRKSSLTFDVKYYLEANSDLKKEFGNNYKLAYEHFLNTGCKEYRKSSAEYDGFFYRYYNSDLTNYSSINLLNHYINSGKNEGRFAGWDYETENLLYNSDIYCNCNNDLKKAYGNNKNNLKIHWIKWGISEGRMASLVFDPKEYLAQNSDLKNIFKGNYKILFDHFINNGIKEGRVSSSVFNVKYYLEANSDLSKAFKTNYKLAFEHFINSGYKENRKSSDEFDAFFYRYNNPDLVNLSAIDLLVHYINFGKSEGRLGAIDRETEQILFDPEIYLSCNSDLQKVYGNNAEQLKIHWIKFGIGEGRRASITYDPITYLAQNKDLKNVFGQNYRLLLTHFVNSGIKEGRPSSNEFEILTYFSQNSDISAKFNNNYKMGYIHFINFGINEARPSSSKFNVLKYLANYEDLRKEYGTNYKKAYIHYIIFGKNEGRIGI